MTDRPLLSLSPLTAVDTSPPDLVTAAAGAGFDYVGIRAKAAATDTQWPMLDDGPMVWETRRRADDLGIDILDVEVLRITGTDDAEVALRILDVASVLRAKYVLVNGNDPEPTRQADTFARLCREAEQRGVALALEFMAFSRIPTLGDATAVLTHAASPAAVLVVDALHLARTGSTADVRAVPDHWLSYAQLCDAPKESPPDHAGLITEARTDRLLPGDGDLPLSELVGALPAGTVYSVEAPVLAHTGWAAEVRAEYAYRALRDTVSPRESPSGRAGRIPLHLEAGTDR
ncbi:sugar phosphate isomerase/epimerase family protein [Rhodococcus jostii]|uniref:Sugar phosphate isomerase/epimerase n=1 Tax=Rhodococcus jostii TaxID=132919 RepID=A0A1H5ENL6_RHOJO|nr:sugar phosphate isomerase/epimerase [Rhodococcus jostii]SED92732.1 Sugar phosphate isomerase/epimerase [Rhodococcus jostii]